MVFHERQMYGITNQNFPAVAYVHSAGFREVFDRKRKKALSHVDDTVLTISQEIMEDRLTPPNPRYGIIILWANPSTGIKTIDAFIYGGLNNWQGNPEIAHRVFTDGKPVTNSTSNLITCGDGIMLLGIEEEFRRKTRDIEEYMHGRCNETDRIINTLSERGLWIPTWRIQ